jgi:hypothetical protein
MTGQQRDPPFRRVQNTILPTTAGVETPGKQKEIRKYTTHTHTNTKYSQTPESQE